MTSLPTRIELDWSEELRFEATNAQAQTLRLDSEGKDGVSPTESLLAAFAGCMAVDVVIILEKMRSKLQGLRIEIEGERAPEPPRYFQRVRLVFHLRGELERDRVERAVALSFDKYCSVFHTLRKDIELSTSIHVNDD